MDTEDSVQGEELLSDDPEPGSEAAFEFKAFDPPLYKQRYEVVFDKLKDERWIQAMSRVVDLGCAELKFLKILRSLPRVREIVGVDIDKDLLDFYQRRLEPLFFHYLEPRTETPLDVKLMQGKNVTNVVVR